MSVTLTRLKPPSTAHRQLRPPFRPVSPPAILPAGDYSVCPQVFFFSRVSWMYRYTSHSGARLCGKEVLLLVTAGYSVSEQVGRRVCLASPCRCARPACRELRSCIHSN